MQHTPTTTLHCAEYMSSSSDSGHFLWRMNMIPQHRRFLSPFVVTALQLHQNPALTFRVTTSQLLAPPTRIGSDASTAAATPATVATVGQMLPLFQRVSRRLPDLQSAMDHVCSAAASQSSRLPPHPSSSAAAPEHGGAGSGSDEDAALREGRSQKEQLKHAVARFEPGGGGLDGNQNGQSRYPANFCHFNTEL